MKVFNISFSPTGGTRTVADLVAEAFEEERVSVDLLLPHLDFGAFAISPDDVCIISIPSFGGRAPATAVERLKLLHGNGARCVLICVYGNRAFEDTLIELRVTAEAAGFRPIAALTAIAEHSIMRQFASGRPDDHDKARIREFANKIAEEIAAGKTPERLIVPGKQPYRDFGGVPFTPKSNRNCIVCQICAKECPVEAIPTSDPRKTDSEKCISCMRCISVCPQGARGLNKIVLKAASAKMAPLFTERKEPELFL